MASPTLGGEGHHFIAFQGHSSASELVTKVAILKHAELQGG